MDKWIDARIDGWIVGWVGGWVNRNVNGWKKVEYMEEENKLRNDEGKERVMEEKN